MSVVRMIVADDQFIACGEPHGSTAEQVYAACSRNPQSLDELSQLLPEFGLDEPLEHVLSGHTELRLEPYDAGLIVVDLAKKWIFAEDSYFGAHRRGSRQPFDSKKFAFQYEFSAEWQFVSEAKWFNYLFDCNLEPYKKQSFDFHDADAFDDAWLADRISRRETAPDFDEEETVEEWDEDFSAHEVRFMNRICTLGVDFVPENQAEKRDMMTLEHVARYDRDAAIALHRIERAQERIASHQIELQAVNNLIERTAAPRWELKQIKLEAEISEQDKSISRYQEDHAAAAAMAQELRSLLATEGGRSVLQDWENEEKNDASDMNTDMPF